MTDSISIANLIEKIQPDEIYNLAAQSHVAVSFEQPEYTAQVDGIGVLRLLETSRLLGKSDLKIYQASTSELFGGLPETAPQSEDTPFHPRSPYAAAKLYAYWVTVNYRESYGLFACNGVLFNHESPRRGETFVTKKITRAVARISQGRQEILTLGNLDAKRDWGYAKDYVECMWMMLQHERADDFVIASGETYAVRAFVEMAFAEVGILLCWSGSGVDEVGVDVATGTVRVRIDERYFRPAEVDLLWGNPAKAQRELGWKPKTSLKQLVEMMVRYDLAHDEYGHPDQ
jgi:GDPmannose 4,6-dehydratase